MSEENQIREKLGNRWWRLNNLYYITDESGKKIKFKPNNAQRLLYIALHYLNVILKARQLGFTTFIQILILDACLFNSNIRAGVIAHTRDDAEVIFNDKIKFAYDNLPDWLKAEIPTVGDSASKITFANNSSIRVGTSLRSGTLQYLHVSELGKIAKKYPEKAKEIKTGALNTVHAGQFAFIESTAEGRGGLFFDLCEESRKIEKESRNLQSTEFKFHFFPWWRDKRYETDPENITLTAKEIEYFDSLEKEHGIELSERKKAWYAFKWRQQKIGESDDMKQEFPSTPDEAFEVEVEGAYYSKQINEARQDGRISIVKYDPALPVNTFWDIGRNDMNCIWFHQEFSAGQHRFIDYYQNCGESLAHYAKVLKGRGYIYGEHHLPHDVVVKDISRGDNKSREEVLRDLGIEPIMVVPRINDVGEGIEMVRNVLPKCWFDKSKCDEGLKGLENYRKQWNEKTQTYQDRPLHDWASNPADAFRQFAQGYISKSHIRRKSKRKRGGAMVA